MVRLSRIFGTKEYSRVWCNLDLCGLLTFEVGECTLFLSFYFIGVRVIPVAISGLFLQRLCFVVLVFLYSMAVISHFRCFSCSCQSVVGAFTDPGSVPSNATYLPNCEEDDRLLFCVKCNAYKPPRAHHCSSCNRCIVRMDHHCPWINNCIGYRNMKFFVLFLAYTFLLCIYTFLMDICRLYYTYKHAEIEDSRIVILTMMTMSLACLFLGFTGSMLSDMKSAIIENTTGIDRLKGKDYKSHRSGFRDYFGERDVFSIRWFFPVSPRFFNLDNVRGYQIQLDSFSICTVSFTREQTHVHTQI